MPGAEASCGFLETNEILLYLNRILKQRLGLDPPIIRFVGLFIILVLALTFILQLSWVDENLVAPYTAFLARISGGILQFLGVPAHAVGTTLRKESFVLEIRRGCDGLEATFLLISACLAYPATWGSRLLGALWGYGLIFILNLARIVGLALIGFGGTVESFEFFHIYISQFAVVALTMVYWILWAGRQKTLSL